MSKSEVIISISIFLVIVATISYLVSRKLNSSSNIILDTAKGFTPNLRKV